MLANALFFRTHKIKGITLFVYFIHLVCTSRSDTLARHDSDSTRTKYYYIDQYLYSMRDIHIYVSLHYYYYYYY